MRTLSTLLLIGLASCATKANYRPARGYVPDAATAIKIAIAVWEPIYGRKQIASEKPIKAELRNGVWTIYGFIPENTPGGVAIAEISQKNGKNLTHHPWRMNASNKSLQPTALWRCASMSILIGVSSTIAQPRSQSGG